MIKNTINAQDETSPVLLRVLSILGIKKEEIQDLGDDYRKNIDSILERTPKARENKKLALYLINEVDVGYFSKLSAELQEDTTIALAALKQDSQIFLSLPGKYRSQISFAQEAIKSLVREKTNFVELEKFITKNFSETKNFQKLLTFYKTYIKTVEYVFQNDIERQLIVLREDKSSFYTQIFEKKLLEQQGKSIKISEYFTKIFLENITSISGYKDLSIEQQQEKKIEIFIKYLGLKNTDITEEIQVFLDSLIDLLHIKKEGKTREENENQEEIKDIDRDNTEKESGEDDFDERFDFCIPYCSYVQLSEGGCYIAAGNNIHIHLSEEEMKQINNRALKNYVEGIKKLTELGFGFALYHQERFFTLCGVDHIYGEGLSDAKILKILNKVGKNIGVPEKSFTKKNENIKGEEEIGCFRSIENAIFQFRRIRDTGKVQENDQSPIIELSKKGSKSILRHICEQKGLFDPQGGAFNISRWK